MNARSPRWIQGGTRPCQSLGRLWRRRLGFREHLDPVRSDHTTLGIVLALRVEGSEPSLGNPCMLSKVDCGARRGTLPNEEEDKQVIGSTGVFGWRSLSKTAICIERRVLPAFIMPSDC